MLHLILLVIAAAAADSLGCNVKPHPEAISLTQVLGAVFCVFVIGQAVVELARMTRQDRCAKTTPFWRCQTRPRPLPTECRGCRNA